MTPLINAAVAGTAGAFATNVLHEITRRVVPNAPRVDVLGMQALAKALTASTGGTPTGGDLYRSTLAGDLVSNAAYFSAVGLGGGNAVGLGLLLGIAAGVGAVVLPPRMGLDPKPTARTGTTGALTVGLYTAGGLVAGLTYAALRDDG